MTTRLPQRRTEGPGVAGPTTGRVVSVRVGVARVATRTGLLTATAGAPLLAAMAADASLAPRPGDRVRLHWWSDGHVTMDRVVARPL